MSSPDPEETPRPETPRRSDDSGLSPGSADARRFEMPEDVDAAFAAIVAEWAGTDAPRWPEDPTAEGLASGVGLATPPQGQPEAHPERRDDDLFTGPTAPGPHSPGAPPPRPEPRPTPPPAPAPHDHTDEHYVPPEPPPLPRIGLSSLLGLLLLVVGVVLLALPAFVGGGFAGLGIVPGLLAMAAGLGWLVVGMRRPSEGPDEGGSV
jgi:hypothetical protein